MNDRRKKFMPKRHRVRFPTHGAPIPTDDFIRRRNEVSAEEENPSVSGIIASASIDIPSTSGEETDDSRPPPGLRGKALGLWHRDRKRKEKKLRKQEKRELKAKKQKKKNVISPIQPEEQHQNGTEESVASDNETPQQSRQAYYGIQLNTRSMSRDLAVPTTQPEKRCRLATEIDSARNQIQQTFATLNKTINEADDCELFGQLLAKKLRNYSIHERHLLMHEIDGLLLRNPPRSTMLSPLSSSCSSSTSSPVNPYAPLSINNRNEPPSTASYALLSSQSPSQVNFSSQPSFSKQLLPQSQQSLYLSSHEATEKVNMSFPQDASHSHQSIVQTAWRSPVLEDEYEEQEQMFSPKHFQRIPLELTDEKVDQIRKIIGNVDFDRIKQLSLEPAAGSSGFNINEKYMDMQDSEFKRRFLKSITGSLENKIKLGGIHTSSLPKKPELDWRYKEELRNKYAYNQDFKHYLSVRENLPAFKKKREIIDTLERTNKLLISGETGCGKTTQVAQFLLEHEIVSNRGSTCCILCTQPRRISAISVAERVAVERGERLGESIGYQIRLEKVMPRSSCSVLFCTTGVLLKYMQTEPLLTFASHIVLDEVHERDTLSDFVITLLRDILPVRPDLKVILMSATLNAEKFSKYFDNCPTIHIPGFTYPVTEYYLEEVLEMTRFKYNLNKQFPKDVIKEREINIMPYLRMLEHEKKYPPEVITSLMHPASEEINLDLIVALLMHICSDPKNSQGAVLIFLPGWDKISKLHKLISENSFFSSSRYVIYPLHSLMPTVSQKSIFSHPPPGKRKIIIATNIAETSITIDDVVFVIDCGKIKIKNFDIDNNITTMKEEWVSLANAQQRKGRAGRVQEGVCYHLFTQGREKILDQYQLPEMLRTRLEEVILQAKILQLGKIEPFLQKVLDPPSPKAVTLSLMLLLGMRALDEEENLTPLGYHLANLPVDPQAGKMLIFASLFSCFDPIASIAACLGFKDPFIIPLGKEKDVDQKKKEICAGMKSDHLLLSEVISEWERAEERRRGWEFCRSYYLSHNTLTQLCEMKNQFARHLYNMRFLDSDKSGCTSGNFNSNYPGLLKAIVCAGLYPNIAIIKKQKIIKKTGMACVVLYTPEDGKVRLHPKSVNYNQGDFRSKFLVYYEKIKSSGILLHDTTMIPPLALIFFCQNLTVTDDEEGIKENGGNKVITVNEYITFTCSSYVAQLIQDLRIALDWILENKIAHPGISDLCDPHSQSLESRLLRAIVELITIEDQEVNFDESDFSDDFY